MVRRWNKGHIFIYLEEYKNFVWVLQKLIIKSTLKQSPFLDEETWSWFYDYCLLVSAPSCNLLPINVDRTHNWLQPLEYGKSDDMSLSSLSCIILCFSSRFPLEFLSFTNFRKITILEGLPGIDSRIWEWLQTKSQEESSLAARKWNMPTIWMSLEAFYSPVEPIDKNVALDTLIYSLVKP